MVKSLDDNPFAGPSETVEVQPGPDPRRSRRHRRYFIKCVIGIRRPGEKYYNDVVIEDISRGGIFLSVPLPPDVGQVMELRLETPDGPIEIQGEVRHTIDESLSKAIGRSAGAGIMFVGMNMSVAEAVQKYVDSIASTTSVVPAPVGMADDNEGETLARAVQHVVTGWLSGENLYEIFDLSPINTQEEIKTRILELQEFLDTADVDDKLPGGVSRDGAQDAIRRFARLLLNPVARIKYDFRHGIVRAEERLRAAARSRGPGAQFLREVWNETFPDSVGRAEKHHLAAQLGIEKGDYAAAVRRVKRALRLDPFNEEYLVRLSEWRAHRDGRVPVQGGAV